MTGELALVADLRARWLDMERRAEQLADPDLSSWVEQTLLAMLAVRDRLEQLDTAELEDEAAA